MNLLQKVAMIAAGFGISGAIGAVSGVLLLYVLIDAAIAGADEAVWLYLCAAGYDRWRNLFQIGTVGWHKKHDSKLNRKSISARL